jgi:hypothetical protein
MKANIARIHPAAALSKQSKQVLKIFGVVQTTLLPPTIIHAFAQAGIHSQYSDEDQCLICRVNPSTARCLRNQEVRVGHEAHCDTSALGLRRFAIA